MNKEKALIIANKIIYDLTGRSGLQNEWELIDEDIQEEIKNTWAEIIEESINQGG